MPMFRRAGLAFEYTESSLSLCWRLGWCSVQNGLSPWGEREWLEATDGDRGGTADGIGEGTRGDEDSLRGGAWVSLNIDLMVVATAENATERKDILTRLRCGFDEESLATCFCPFSADDHGHSGERVVVRRGQSRSPPRPVRRARSFRSLKCG